MKGAETSGQLLLTDEEIRTYLRTILHRGFTQYGNMSVPTTAQYNVLGTNEGLKEVFNDLCRWLGTKPSGVTVAYGDMTQPLYRDHTITIPTSYASHPLAVGGLLAMATMTYYLERYGHTTPAQNVVEFATIETGLGLWVLNGLPLRAKHRHSIYHVLRGHDAHHIGVPLEHYTATLYGHNLAAYAHANHILAEQYLGGTSATHRYLLPAIVTTKSNRSLPLPQAVAIHHAAAKQLWVRSILLVSIVAAVITLGIVAYATSRPAVTFEQKQSEAALLIMKDSLASCLSLAEQQQNTFDPNDFSLTRQIDATKVRCESLRNEYNYALKQHQAIYLQ